MPRMTGKQILMEMLRAEGVKYVFGNPGTSEAPVTDVIQDYPDIQYITALQEASAIGMADGYARYTGEPTFVNVHITVGLANALSGLYNAYRGGTPMVVTAGQTDTRLSLHEPTLWSDMAEVARRYARWSCEVVHAVDLPAVLRRAFKMARTPPTGPVFLSLPWNVMDEEAEVEIVPSSPVHHRLRPDPQGVEEAVKLLARAHNPLMLVGDRIAQSRAVEEAVALAELLGARVHALSFSEVNFPTGHPQYQGALYTGWLSRGVKDMLESADVILAVGCDLVTQYVYTPEPVLGGGARIVQLDSNPWEIEKRFPVAVGIWADPKMGMRELSEALERETPATVREAATTRAAALAREKAQRREAFHRRAQEVWGRTPVAVEQLMVELGNALPPNAVIADESVSSRGALVSAIEFNRTGDYFTLRGGGLGWAMPGALGIKQACPERPVVAVVGDGAAMYTVQALWTAARYSIPVTYVICNNRTYKVLKEGLLRYLAGTGRESQFVGLDFYEKPLNLARIAESFDLLGLKVERPEELRPALDRAFSADKAAVVDVSIAEDLRPQAVQEEWLAWYRS